MCQNAAPLCMALSSLKHMETTQGGFTVATHTSAHISQGGYNRILPVYAGEIRLPELITALCDSLLPNIKYMGMSVVHVLFLKSIMEQTLLQYMMQPLYKVKWSRIMTEKVILIQSYKQYENIIQYFFSIIVILVTAKLTPKCNQGFFCECI